VNAYAKDGYWTKPENFDPARNHGLDNLGDKARGNGLTIGGNDHITLVAIHPTSNDHIHTTPPSWLPAVPLHPPHLRGIDPVKAPKTPQPMYSEIQTVFSAFVSTLQPGKAEPKADTMPVSRVANEDSVYAMQQSKSLSLRMVLASRIYR
jgi:hypothetical protein